MASEDRLDLPEIVGRRHDHPAGAHHRLSDEGGHGLGSHGLDQRLELPHQPVGEGLLALARPSLAVVARRRQVEEAVAHRQIEAGAGVGEAGQMAGRHRHPVVAAAPGDDALLLRPAAGVVVVPSELDGGVHRFGARIHEEGAGDGPRCERGELLRQQDDRLAGAMGEGVGVGDPFHLAAGRVDQALLAEAERHAPEPRQALDVLAALRIPDPDAVPLGDHQRPPALVGAQIGVGMDEMRDVARFERVGRGHLCDPGRW